MKTKRKRISNKKQTCAATPSVKCRKAELGRLAADLGFGGLLDWVPTKALSGLEGCGLLPPCAVADASFAADPDHKSVVQQTNRAITKCRFTPEGQNREYTLTEYLSTAMTLRQLLIYVQGRYPRLEQPRTLATALSGVINEDSFLSACETLVLEVLNTLVDYMRFDERILLPTLKFTRPFGYLRQPTVRIHRVSPRIRDVTVDGCPRRAYQCGSVYDEDVVHWLEWPPGPADVCRDTRPKPVFVQSHAIRRLLSRIGQYAYPNDLLDAMYLSLRDPRFVPNDSVRDRLVEYKLWGRRLGYLVVSELDGLFVIRTFLFLTMRGTPEEAAIRKKFNGYSRTAELMGLDRLSCFIQTDVRHDQELRGRLSECGCGQLFEMADQLFKDECVLKHAQHIRRILGLKRSDQSSCAVTLD